MGNLWKIKHSRWKAAPCWWENFHWVFLYSVCDPCPLKQSQNVRFNQVFNVCQNEAPLHNHFGATMMGDQSSMQVPWATQAFGTCACFIWSGISHIWSGTKRAQGFDCQAFLSALPAISEQYCCPSWAQMITRKTDQGHKAGKGGSVLHMNSILEWLRHIIFLKFDFGSTIVHIRERSQPPSILCCSRKSAGQKDMEVVIRKGKKQRS